MLLWNIALNLVDKDKGSTPGAISKNKERQCNPEMFTAYSYDHHAKQDTLNGIILHLAKIDFNCILRQWCLGIIFITWSHHICIVLSIPQRFRASNQLLCISFSSITHYVWKHQCVHSFYHIAKTKHVRGNWILVDCPDNHIHPWVWQTGGSVAYPGNCLA